MKLSLPRKRAILALHRWLGALSAIFLLVLSVTGIALNHTALFKLDQVKVRNSVILKRYGMMGADAVQSYRIGGHDTLSVINGRLFFNLQSITESGSLIGILEGDPMLVVATSEDLVFLTKDGEWVETLASSQLPFDKLTGIGLTSDKQTVLVAENGTWVADAEWLNFRPYEGSYTSQALKPNVDDPDLKSALLAVYQGEGVSLYRFLLDVHSGRFLGWGGRTAMDLTAVAILLLISTGISGWLRKSGNQNKPFNS